MSRAMAAWDRGEVWAVLDDHGPLTCTELTDILCDIMLECDGTPWWYGRTYNALHGLLREGHVAAAGKGSGQYILWFVPAMVPA